ncbi:Tse2 family ADP-ribosyltransferase toxin [Endozoicomonas numazuensis]|uniref:Tse2 family ADP-ribosyltransferase toxin n=1 Tax=Endozoicomonas numazuensis TaxID=1137799 RepID=UPI0038B27AD5
MLSNGRPRAADIKIYEHRNGEKWVSVEDRPRGLSTFDKEGCPPGNGWEYYKIPAGTILPEELAIVKDQYNKRYDATHYTIAPAYDMSLVQFKSALATFAAELFNKAV